MGLAKNHAEATRRPKAPDEIEVRLADIDRDLIVLAQDNDLIFVDRAKIPDLIEALRKVWVATCLPPKGGATW